MINDITFGQYFPRESFIHKLDSRTKIILLIVFIIFCFICDNIFSLSFYLVCLIAVMLVSKIPMKMYLKNIKAILPIIILTSILNAFYVKTGNELLSWKFITVTDDGLLRAIFMSLRIVMLIFASAIFSYTTTPTSITNAIESLLSPLKIFKLQNAVHTLAMTMTIALRFIPTLIEETNKLMNAQKARGADMESGGLFSRVKALLPILIPLIISSVRRAYELAESMECRCYNGGEGRTKYVVMKYTSKDFLSFALTLVLSSAILVINFFK